MHLEKLQYMIDVSIKFQYNSSKTLRGLSNTKLHVLIPCAQTDRQIHGRTDGHTDGWTNSLNQQYPVKHSFCLGLETHT